MSTMTGQISAERVLPKPTLVPLPPAEKGARPKWFKWLLLGLLALVLVSGGIVWRAHVQNAISYEVVPIERGNIQATVTATGTLNPVVDVQVGSQVSGNIKELYADFNTKVKKGQLVALIEPQIFQAQVDQAQATVNSLHSAVLTAEAQVEKSRTDLAAAVANGKSAEAVAAKDRANELNAKVQWERAESLFASGVMSEQDHDTAKATYEALQAQVAADQAQIDAAKQTIQSAEAGVKVALSQLASAQAQERQAQASLDQARINLAHTRITAPVDGTVIARRMDVGQTVAASFQAPTIFEIAQDLTKMQVDTNVDESDVGNVVNEQMVTFTVDSYPGIPFRGQVTDIRKAPIITQNVVTYDVVVGVSNPDLKLLPGMTANVTILTAKAENTLKVPNAVLRYRPSAQALKQSGLSPSPVSKQFVYVLANGKLKAVPVSFGLSDGAYTALKAKDVKEGDLVVVRASAQSSATSATTTAPSGGPRVPRL